MEKGRGKGTDTLATDNVFTRKEYIERKKVVELLNKWADGYSYIELPTKDAIVCVRAIPAADVMPVRHGKWIKVDDGIYYHMECSLCRERPLRNRWVDDNELSPYCPNCGAKMDKDGDSDA